jgi:hypothetical protein
MKKPLLALGAALLLLTLPAACACPGSGPHGGPGRPGCPKHQDWGCKCRPQPDCPQHRPQEPPPPPK